MNVEQVLGSGFSNVSAEATGPEQLGQDDFLKLLVAQMKNQDPSNPADNGEFLSQIAQFSMVSGIDELGASFNGIASSMYSTQAMQAASLVGREVLTESNTAQFVPGEIVDGLITFEDSANAAQLTITNAAGIAVRTQDLGVTQAGQQTFGWDGTDDLGAPLPAGEYQFLVTGFVDGEQISMPVSLFKTVESVSVDRSNSSIQLHLSDQNSVGFSEISEYK